jgi:hypothetical protein
MGLIAAAHAPFWLPLTLIILFSVVVVEIAYRRRRLRPLLAAYQQHEFMIRLNALGGSGLPS